MKETLVNDPKILERQLGDRYLVVALEEAVHFPLFYEYCNKANWPTLSLEHFRGEILMTGFKI